MYRSHPARANLSISDYYGKIISKAICYSSNYLLEMLKIHIPKYTRDDMSFKCIFNDNSKRNPKTKNINGLEFNKLAIDLNNFSLAP